MSASPQHSPAPPQHPPAPSVSRWAWYRGPGFASLSLALAGWLLLGLMGLYLLVAPHDPEDAEVATGLAVIGVGGLLIGGLAVGLGVLTVGLRRPNRPYPLMTAVSGLLSGLGSICGWVVFLAVTVLPGLAGEGGSKLTDIDFSSDPAALTEVADPRIADALRANVLIESDFGWRGVSSGSGVILAVRDGRAVIATNRHVVDPSFRDGDGTRPSDLSDLSSLRLQLRTLGESSQPAEVIWLAPDGIDLALVQVSWEPSSAAGPARWARSRPLRIGARVFAVGNPQKLDWTYTEGCISQLRFRQQAERRLRIIQTQTPITFGNSGGGLYDSDGFLIGINTWTLDKRSSEGLSFAISLDALLELEPAELKRP